MATELIPAGGLTLTGESTSQKHPSAAVLLNLPGTTINQLKSAVNGVQLITTGQKSTIRYGDRSIELSLTPEDHVSDVFEFKAGNVLSYTSSVSYRAQVGGSSKKEEDVDEALLALKNSMAMLEQEKKAQQIHVADAILPEPKNRWVAAKQQKKTSGLLEAEERKHLSLASRSPALAPTSQPAETAPKTRAMRKVVVHLIATKPLTMANIAEKTCIPMLELKNMLPSIGQNVEGKWKLLDRAYKELDIWRFKYTSKEERINARENAISAYGRLRLSKDDPLWQLLLPVSERGQGKVLSRLNLHVGASSTPRPDSPHADGFPASDVSARTTPSGTPTLGAHKKTNSGDIMKRLLSKDPKKARAAEEAKEKKRKERQSQDSEHESRAAKRQTNSASKKAASTVKSAEFVYSSEDEQDASQVKPQVNGLQKKNSQPLTKASDVSNTKNSAPKQHTSPQSSTVKTENKQPPRAQNRLGPSPRQNSPSKHNRPSVPSPLGAAQPRNASDGPERSAVKLARRAAEQPKGLGITAAPARRRHDTVTNIDSSEEVSSNSSASMAKKSSNDSVESKKVLRPGSKAREAANARAAKAIAENSARNQGLKSGQPSGNNSISSNDVNNGHHRNSSSDDRSNGAYSDSSISVIDTITFTQGVELAQKFQDDYYPQYAKMYDSISDRQARGVTVSIAETKKLWEMHERLKQMKREIEAASERQARGGDSRD